ncbi:MAG: hypothetical protein V3U75_08830 [Methylococcaceae bacterium]
MNVVKMVNTALLFIVSLLAFSFTASAGSSFWDQDWGRGFYQRGPDNLGKAMTFISTRAFDSVDGTFFLDGMIKGDGMDFFKNTMGLSEEEIEMSREKALAFYKKRFGLDIDDPKVYFTGFQIDPAAGYKVIMATGKRNHLGKGYPIVDGGWAYAVVDPEGLDLGGEFEGTHVPAGTMFAFGNYVIKRGRGRKDLVLSYKSRGPMQPVGTGGVINCEVSHPKFGEGVGWGYFEFHELANGQVSAQVRNVLTFPKFGYDEELIGQQ